MPRLISAWCLRLLALLVLGSGAALAQTAQDPTTLWQELARPTFDARQVAVVEHLQLERDVATLTLVNGEMALGQAFTTPRGTERRLYAAFKGQGRLRLAPTLPMERQQLALHSGGPELDTEFEEAVFLSTDNTVEELTAKATFQPGDPQTLEKICHDRINHWINYGLNMEGRLLKAVLADDPSLHSIFVAALKTSKHGWLHLVVDAADPEEIEVWHFDSSRHAVSIWTKFPAGGGTPQEAFADPTAHHDYLLQSYKLNVTVDGTELVGQAEVELLVRRPGERVLLMALDPSLRVSEVKTEAGESLAFFQPRDPKDDFFWGDYLVVAAEEPFPPGTQRLRFAYRGKRVVSKVGPGNYFCQSFGWYPTYSGGRYSLTTNTFAGRYNFDITLRLDKKHEVIATGRKVEESKDKKHLITRWKSELPLAVAGFAFGDYKIHTLEVGDTRVEVYANRKPDDFMRGIEVMS